MQARHCSVGLLSVLLAVSAVAQTTVTNGNNGTSNTVPVYTGSATLGNSVITQSGGHVGIGTASPQGMLHINGPNQNGNVNPLFKATDTNTGQFFAIDNGVNANDFRIVTWGGTTGNLELQAGGNSAQMVLNNSGNVGIGTISPGAKFEVNGNVKLTSGSGASITFSDGTVQSTAWTGTLCGGDYAESVDVTGDRTHYQPGDVLVVDPTHPGHFLKSSERYSTSVAGIYSTKPGLIGRRQTTDPKLTTTEVPMAMVGIVPTKVTAENGPIHPGDILVTSSIPGRAMKGTDRSLFAGAIVGKALGSLNSGNGVVEVLVSLQ